MKNFINAFMGFVLTIWGAMMVVSCDPCASVVCTNGNCSNGTCVCIAGYEKMGTACVAVNEGYVGTGTITATVTSVDSNGVSNTTNNVGYTLEQSTTDPFSFTLKSFANVAGNDIMLTISSTNYDVIPSATVMTTANKTYTVSGAKTGSQVQLTLLDTGTQITYTIAYTIP